MNATETVIAHLARLKFQIQMDHVELFGESLALVKAVAVDSQAHQLVLVADGEGIDLVDDEQDRLWSELLFAISGLRHQLRGGGAPALGAPILLAVVDEDRARRLQGLVEDIAESYALFTRIDLNIIDAGKVEAGQDGALDISMASLLPHVRRAIDDEVTVATQDVEQFWHELAVQVRGASEALERSFGNVVPAEAANEILEQLHEGDQERPSFRRALPVASLTLENFRSFDHATIDLPPVAVVRGVNGSGKTSICEALEILWSGQTQRIPDDVEKLSDYERHLNRNGQPFALDCAFGFGADAEPCHVSELRDTAAIPLGRTVLAQHVLTSMASSAPRERFRAFLDASGLDLPELDDKVDRLRRSAFEEANEALGQAGITPMPAVNRNGLDHLDRALAGGFAQKLPSIDSLVGAGEALDRITAASYSSRRVVPESELPRLLAEVDEALLAMRADIGHAPDPTLQIEAALEGLRSEARRLRSYADPLRVLSQQFSRQFPPSLPEGIEATPSSRSPVPHELAARWLTQARGLERSVSELEELASRIDDVGWGERLQRYIAALRTASKKSSADELEALVAKQDILPRRTPLAVHPDPGLLEQSGFSRPPDASRPVIAAMGQMQAQLSDRAAALDALAVEIERHPARAFVSVAARVMPALCRFELARELTKPRGAVARARGTLVSELLDERLFPVVRELVSALVRFEWYFDPLELVVDRQGLRISGGANSDPDQDIRMLLNAAERTVVGVAWFLALHILQPKEDRKVLVLDDPASGFDAMNKAAFVATLRSVAHLLEPEQLLITTHDDVLVALLEQEFAPVGGWPGRLEFLRCRRTDTGASKIELDERRVGPLGKTDLGGELRKLALDGGGMSSSA